MKLSKREYVPLQKNEYSIRRDEVFKIVFGSNERSEYLKAFLESILHKRITNIVIRNDVALDKLHADNKLMRLDILAEIDGKEKINVEMQNKNEYNIKERTDAYASGIFYNSLMIGNNYIEAKKTIVIWILGFNLFEDGSYHEIARTRRDFNNEIVSENIECHFFQIPRFLEQIQEIKTAEEQWLAYLSGNLNKEEMEELFKMNRSIEEINRIVDIVLTDKDVQDELNNRILERNLEYLKQKKAFEDGKAEEKKEVAISFLKKNIDIKIISECTGLTIEEIKKLKN